MKAQSEDMEDPRRGFSLAGPEEAGAPSQGCAGQVLNLGNEMGKEGSGRFHGKGQGLPNHESPFACCPLPRVGSALPTQLHARAAGVKRMWVALWLVCTLQPSVPSPHPPGLWAPTVLMGTCWLTQGIRTVRPALVAMEYPLLAKGFKLPNPRAERKYPSSTQQQKCSLSPGDQTC